MYFFKDVGSWVFLFYLKKKNHHCFVRIKKQNNYVVPLPLSVLEEITFIYNSNPKCMYTGG